MESFYKISKIDATKIWKFEYDKNKVFDLFCAEQTDNTYLISVTLVESLKDNENIKKIDWDKLIVIYETEINTKQISLWN